MVSLIFGTPGSGKTTCGAFLALLAANNKPLRIGGYSLQDIYAPYERIYTNFPISIPGKTIYKWENEVFEHDVCCKSLYILDEAAQLWDSRDFKRFDADVKEWFAIHRHRGCDVVLISQGFKDCDLRIRNLADMLFLLEKSAIPNHSKITPLVKYARLEHGEILEGYEPAPPIKCRWFNRSRLYQYFDSYSAPALPGGYDPVPWMPEDARSR